MLHKWLLSRPGTELVLTIRNVAVFGTAGNGNSDIIFVGETNPEVIKV
jgi:hypothetical protein